MIREIGVVIPVRNEEDLLPTCLRGVRAAAERLALRRSGVRTRVVVVLDTCTDASAHAVAAFADVEPVEVAVRNVGAARRIGTARVLDTPTPLSQLLIASTDADSLVPVDWLTSLIDLVDSGAELVLGTVRPSFLPGPVRAAYRRDYALVDGHPHVHGANLAIRADTYLTAGGWPELLTGEDQALADRVEQLGCAVQRTASAPVRTSSRLDARAPFGYSSHLRGVWRSAAGR